MKDSPMKGICIQFLNSSPFKTNHLYVRCTSMKHFEAILSTKLRSQVGILTECLNTDGNTQIRVDKCHYACNTYIVLEEIG